MADQVANQSLATLIDRAAADQNLQNAIRALQVHYGTPLQSTEEVLVLEDAELTYEMISQIRLTSTIFNQLLPEQTVTVKCLRSDQRLVIPGILGMTWHSAHDDFALCSRNTLLLNRYWRLTSLSYADMAALVARHTSVRDLRTEIDAIAVSPLIVEARYVEWDKAGWARRADGSLASFTEVDVTFAILSRSLQMNADARDFGFLCIEDNTVKDSRWMSYTTDTIERLRNKLKAYTVQMIAALNYESVGSYALGGWVRAYGLSMGVYPHRESVSRREVIFVTRMASADATRQTRDCDQKYGNILYPICANIIAIFGLLHLNKDRTYRTGDANLDRIGTSYIFALRPSVSVTLFKDMLAHKEVVLCTAALPFGLAQTYWLAKLMGNIGRLMPALAIYTDVTPPPVQRVFIVLKAAHEWDGLPAGQKVSEIYREKLDYLKGIAEKIRELPPSYSKLHRLYGVAEKLDLGETVHSHLKALMPAVFGFAMAAHITHDNKKDGIALELNLGNVERDMKGLNLVWLRAWEKYLAGRDKVGLDEFIKKVRASYAV